MSTMTKPLKAGDLIRSAAGKPGVVVEPPEGRSKYAIVRFDGDTEDCAYPWAELTEQSS